MALKAIADHDLKPGMIVSLPYEPGKWFEVLSVNGCEKVLLELPARPTPAQQEGQT